ncbi:MAG: 2-C-methyl-D-erythritol 4-phosphate cytidylyltransferase [Acidimicrobiales bacterium]
MVSPTRVGVVVVAAGSGDRFGGPKQLAPFGSARVVDHAVQAAREVAEVVVVVVPQDQVPAVARSLPADVTCTAGGDTRSASVRAGLVLIPTDCDIILVHDGARPLAGAQLFRRVVDAVIDGADAVVPAVAVTDSIRHRDDGAVDRHDLVAVQTPQGFRADLLRSAHAGNDDATDDAALVEAVGGKVVLVDGETTNLKITNPQDLRIAEGILKERP